MHDQVFVAPHYDDVALSCGGAVAVAARDGSPMILTLFAGQPDNLPSEFARFQHERWGLDDHAVAESRRIEDRCAAAALGATVHCDWLDFLDAIYRNDAYASDEALFGALLRMDMPLIDSVAAALAELQASEYIVPLGIGNHVDHQIAFLAGHRLAAMGCEVWAYADMPYALQGSGGLPPAQDLNLGERRLTALDDEAFERKMAAIACYVSQVPVIFRHVGDPRAAMERHALALGGGYRAEAHWRVRGTARDQ